MRYAINTEGDKIEVSYSKQEALCPDCKLPVFGRKGRVRPKYWRHANNSDCDNWHEPITKWHIDWQDEFDKKFQEIQLIDENTGETHRADIKLSNGTVIEVQNSPITIDEIEARETFYGTNHMIWILNGENLLKHCEIRFNFLPKTHGLSIIIADYLPDVPDYNMDEFNEMLFSAEEFNSLKELDPNLKIDTQNGCYHFIDFATNQRISHVDEELKWKMKQIFTSRFGYQYLETYKDNFSVTYDFRPTDSFENTRLNKKYWRKFIDHLQYPVFIDNLNGMKNGYVYHLQSNQIISRKYLINRVKKEKNWPQSSRLPRQ